MGKLMPGSKLMEMEYTLVDGLSAEMQAALGEIEDTFTAIAWGVSANGKTSFVLKMVKELQPLGNLLYVSYEEGHGKSMRDAVRRSGVDTDKLQVLDHATFDELYIRLKKKKSAKIVVIDSIQYSRFTYEQYQQLKEQFVFGRTAGRRKIIIFISHASGSLPKGSAANDIMYDVNIKIRVEGFIAFIQSRFANTMNFCIHEEKARNYWGDEFEAKLYGGKRNIPKKPRPKKVKPEKTTANEDTPIE